MFRRDASGNPPTRQESLRHLRGFGFLAVLVGITLFAIVALQSRQPEQTPRTGPLASKAAPPDRSERNCGQAPGRCGYPDADSTGVPQGTTFTRVPQDATSGQGWVYDKGNDLIRVDQDGAVLDGIDTTATIDVQGSDVIIKNSRVQVTGERWAIGLRSGSGILVEHNDLFSPSSSGQDRMLLGIYQMDGARNGTVIRANDIRHASTGIVIEAGLVADNYIHDPAEKPGDHLNGITSGGASTRPLVIRHNTVLNQHAQTDAISLFQDFGPQRNRVVDNNLIGGGSYALYAGGGNGKDATATNITITDNRFAQTYFEGSGHFGAVTNVHAGGGNVFTGNFFDKTLRSVQY